MSHKNLRDPLKALRLLALGLAATFALGAPSASALTITNSGNTGGNPSGPLYNVHLTQADVGTSFDVNWFVNSANVSGLTYDLRAVANLLVLSLNNTTLNLRVTLTNTTTSALQGSIVSFGFGVAPDVSASMLDPGDIFDGVSTGKGGQQSFPGGFKGIDVCILSSGCSGGSVNQGLKAGMSDTVDLAIQALAPATFTNGVTLASFPLKFQTAQGSYEPGGVPGQPVPEPGTLALLGSALAGLGLKRRLAGNRPTA